MRGQTSDLTTEKYSDFLKVGYVHKPQEPILIYRIKTVCFPAVSKYQNLTPFKCIQLITSFWLVMHKHATPELIPGNTKRHFYAYLSQFDLQLAVTNSTI